MQGVAAQRRCARPPAGRTPPSRGGGGKDRTTNEGRDFLVSMWVMSPAPTGVDAASGLAMIKNKPNGLAPAPWLRAMERHFHPRLRPPFGRLALLKAKAATLMRRCRPLGCGSEGALLAVVALSLCCCAGRSTPCSGSSTSCCRLGCGSVAAADHRSWRPAGPAAGLAVGCWPARARAPDVSSQALRERSPAARRRRSATCRPSTRC